MSKCDITIELDQQFGRIVGWDMIRGVARVLVNNKVTCDAIRLNSHWETHGEGNTDKHPYHVKVMVSDSRLGAREVFEFRLSFPADCAALTDHGHHINIDHCVRVDVDVLWFSTPKSLRSTSCGWVNERNRSPAGETWSASLAAIQSGGNGHRRDRELERTNRKLAVRTLQHAVLLLLAERNPGSRRVTARNVDEQVGSQL